MLRVSTLGLLEFLKVLPINDKTISRRNCFGCSKTAVLEHEQFKGNKATTKHFLLHILLLCLYGGQNKNDH